MDDAGGSEFGILRLVYGKTGFLVSSSDASALAHGISRYIDDPNQMLQRVRNGREKVEIQFDLNTMVDRYVVLYDDVMFSD